MNIRAVREAFENTRARLMAARDREGVWRGRLSSSAPATATAIGALAALDRARHAGAVRRGLRWLADNANTDGGWGDTPQSRSNPAATVLAWSVLGGRASDECKHAGTAAASWIVRWAGGCSPRHIAAGLDKRYGGDRTFSVPILAFAAAAGRFGEDGWGCVRQLPFELGLLPHRVLKWLRLPVVSYALPALLAVGLARHHHRPTRRPVARLLRAAVAGAALEKLGRIQPAGGGFLEAIPLTAFTAACLSAAGRSNDPVAERAERFLSGAQREDGSWPVDTDLAMWLTTGAVTALGQMLPREDIDRTRAYVLGAQHTRHHPYTGAEPGGWGWTELSGGVPDADDTAGALLALAFMGPGGDPDRFAGAVAAGARWLLRMRNDDGGWPTFCRGWGRLPFDRSCPDITAHAVAALSAAAGGLSRHAAASIRAAVDRALGYLAAEQAADGSFSPLWFGNEDAENERNPVYGSAVVVRHLLSLRGSFPRAAKIVHGSIRYLVSAAHPSGGWGGSRGLEPTVEETAVAAEALGRAGRRRDSSAEIGDALEKGIDALLRMTDRGRRFPAAPIGLYFARLWYYETLYPVLYSLRALSPVAGDGSGG